MADTLQRDEAVALLDDAVEQYDRYRELSKLTDLSWQDADDDELPEFYAPATAVMPLSFTRR